MNNNKHAMLGRLSLILITVGAVDSVRNLPATALFGSALIVIFTLASLLFLLPSGLVAAELAATWPHRGGVYRWMSLAFGKRWGFLGIWFQWMENVFWYPTILSFVAGTIGYIVNPALINNKWFIFIIINSVFWLMTYLNLQGMRVSALISNLCSILGLILPMALIVFLGMLWLINGFPKQIAFTWQELSIWHHPQTLTALTAVILCCCGIEITSVHAAEVRDPQRNYPTALGISVIFIWATLLLGALAIAMVVPKAEMSLVAGVMQAFGKFFNFYHLTALLPVLAISLIFGSLGGLSSWLLAPCKGLSFAIEDIKQSKVTTLKAPRKLLLLQAVLISILSTFFVFSAQVNRVYWVLTVLASQVYMLMYIMMFVAVIVLRYRHPQVVRPFRIPGGNVGLWMVSLAGIFACVLTLAVGFIPPANLSFASAHYYDLLIAVGLILVIGTPWLWLRHYRQPLKEDINDNISAKTIS